jgi:predicted nucleotidyltransferase
VDPERSVVDEIVERIRAHARPDRIILFGSRAWGTARPDSDVDLLVIVDSEDPPVERAVALGRLFRPRPAPLDLLVLTPSEVRERLGAGDPFLRRILEEGEVLYDALAA